MEVNRRLIRITSMAVLTILIFVLAVGRAVKAQDTSGFNLQESVAGSQLVCSTSKLVVFQTDSVAMRVFIPDSKLELKNHLNHSWIVTGGVVEDKFPEAVWKFNSQQPGEYTATIRVEDIRFGKAESSVRVFVEEAFLILDPERGLARETGSALLLPGKMEMKGYDLYTYILLAAPPIEANQTKYEEFLTAFLTMVPHIKRLEYHIPPSELNVAYLPVTEFPTDTLIARDLVKFALDKYDYARARLILRSVPGVHRDGPYIVSAPIPIDGKTQLLGPYVRLDLTHFPSALVGQVVKEFLIQAAQESFEQERVLPRLALKMRATVNVLGQALPDIKGALEKWISFIN